MKVELHIKPLFIEVPPERERIYKRVKILLAEAERIANTRKFDIKLRLRAMDVAARLSRVLLGILSDTELETIERDLEEIKAQAHGKT